MTTCNDEPSLEEQKLIEARAYINSAPTLEERARRKQEMYHVLYSSASNLFDYLKAEAKQGANPLDTDTTQ